MTYADQDFIPVEGREETPSYPTAFGITFTPKVSGIVLAVLGLLGATYLLVNVVQPEWQRYQDLKTEIADKNATLQNPEEIRRQIEAEQQKLGQARQRNRQVLSLFANERTLETLLLDLNSFVKDRRGTLVRFQPSQSSAQPGQGPDETVNDSSLGPAVNGKLKRRSFDVQLEGSFDQVLSSLRSLERLQSLVLIKDFKAEITEPQSLRVERGRVVAGDKPTIRTTSKLEALSPVNEATPEEPAKTVPTPRATPGATPRATPGATPAQQ